MPSTNMTHLRNLATARAILSLLATSDDPEGVAAILAGDREAEDAGGITPEQRARYIDVTDGADCPLAAADQLTTIIWANHGTGSLPITAGNIDLVRSLRLIDQEIKQCRADASARELAFAINKIAYLVSGPVALLAPIEGEDEVQPAVAAE